MTDAPRCANCIDTVYMDDLGDGFYRCPVCGDECDTWYPTGDPFGEDYEERGAMPSKLYRQLDRAIYRLQELDCFYRKDIPDDVENAIMNAVSALEEALLHLSAREVNPPQDVSDVYLARFNETAIRAPLSTFWQQHLP